MIDEEPKTIAYVVFEKCAICELDDYHDSDQYVCDGCLSELESLAAEQSASKWD